MKRASYKVVALNDHSTPPNCPANATSPVGKSENPAGAWFWTKEGTCVFVRVGWADTKPVNAAPVHTTGYPGLCSAFGVVLVPQGHQGYTAPRMPAGGRGGAVP